LDNVDEIIGQQTFSFENVTQGTLPQAAKADEYKVG